jgi:calcineurin-like phosphoesterase family protein
MIFFTSDTHFSHKNIIKYCHRPFVDETYPDLGGKTDPRRWKEEEMNEEMIRRWNKRILPNDTVYHLGDFAFKNLRKAKEIREQLNGKIYMIRGNHDTGENFGFEWMKDYYELKVGNQDIVLFHYGMRTWHHDLRGTWHLYGHSHDGLPPYGKSFDVGVDAWDFYPVSFTRVREEMDKREIGLHPGFAEFIVEQKEHEQPGDHREETGTSSAS